MKRLILLALLIVTVLVGNLLMVRREQDTNKHKLNQALATITPNQVKDGVVLGCKVVAVQQRDDYPAVLTGKSVPQIRQLILDQPPSC
ncbi:MAG TPA: hypothetical protein VLF43_03915 [Candidatus Saccharimonadales bacterium]|nr:hypothetical protein [Candidatus Saccharimonadales bacterium]